jgi:hypothetical protein
MADHLEDIWKPDVESNVDGTDSAHWSSQATIVEKQSGDMAPYALLSVVNRIKDIQRVKIYNNMGYNLVPVYDSYDRFIKMQSEKLYMGYNAVMQNLPIACFSDMYFEDALKQILDFRKDKKAVRKYRDLRVWLSHGLAAESLDQASDIVNQKIDDYVWSIEKHGFKTVTGAFSQILSWRFAALGTAAITAGEAALGPLGAVAAGTLVAGVQIACTLVDKLIDMEDTARGPNREIAIIYDINRRFGQ